MANFEIALKETLEKEGGFSNHPNDIGGKTMYGIIESEARAFGFTGDMKDLPIETAKQIYKKNYWDKLKLDKVNSQLLANELFDTAVNCGTFFPRLWLQENLNVLNNNQKYWKDIEEDGAIGDITIQTLNDALTNYPKTDGRLIKLMNIDQGKRYKEICIRNKSQEVFLGGWLDQRVKI